MREYNWFWFNGHKSTEFGLVVSKRPAYKQSKQNVETVVVPGRNGALTRFLGTYGTRQQEYECWFFAIGDVVEQSRKITEWLNGADGYSELYDSYDPTYFSRATFINDITIANRLNRTGTVTIKFTCQPERWNREGQEWITYDTTGYYNYFNKYQPCRPLFHYTPTGERELSYVSIVNNSDDGSGRNKQIDIDGLSREMYIDTESRNAYSPDGENLNNLITLRSFETVDGVTRTVQAYDYPFLHSGWNAIINNSGGKIEMMPRTWRL